MDNERDQSKVAYESAPKEVNTKRRMTNSKEQFGNGDTMPQENKGYKQKHYPANPTLRHNEYR
jgi:hypothetical protein